VREKYEPERFVFERTGDQQPKVLADKESKGKTHMYLTRLQMLERGRKPLSPKGINSDLLNKCLAGHRLEIIN
jgi:hypothetical protein